MRIGDWSSDVCSSDLIGAWVFPWIAVAQPMIWLFDLPAGLDLLGEQAVFEPKPVTVSRKAERRQTVKETGGQAAEPAMDRKSVVYGTRGDVRVGLGGRPAIKNKKKR